MLCADSVLGPGDLSGNKRDGLLSPLQWRYRAWTYVIFTNICLANEWKVTSLYFSRILLVCSPRLGLLLYPFPVLHFSLLHTLVLANFCVNDLQTCLSCLCRDSFIFPFSWLETCKLICQLRNRTHSNSNYHLPLTNVLLLLTFILVWAQLTLFLVTHL